MKYAVREEPVRKTVATSYFSKAVIPGLSLKMGDYLPMASSPKMSVRETLHYHHIYLSIYSPFLLLVRLLQNGFLIDTQHSLGSDPRGDCPRLFSPASSHAPDGVIRKSL